MVLGNAARAAGLKGKKMGVRDWSRVGTVAGPWLGGAGDWARTACRAKSKKRRRMSVRTQWCGCEMRCKNREEAEEIRGVALLERKCWKNTRSDVQHFPVRNRVLNLSVVRGRSTMHLAIGRLIFSSF